MTLPNLLSTESNVEFAAFCIITKNYSNFFKELELNKKINEEITHIQEEKQASNHKIFWKPVNILKTRYNVGNNQIKLNNK